MSDAKTSLLSPETAAEFLGLSATTLSSWRTRPPKGGGPTFIKVGRLIRYMQSDLDDFIERGRRHNTSQAEAAR